MEYWDVCDQNGRRTGAIRPKGASYAAGEFHPAIEAWVINSRSEILIQQRSMQCEILPGVWALTTGRMLAGEGTAQGCIRELREELGITVTPEQLTFVGSLSGARGRGAGHTDAPERGGRTGKMGIPFCLPPVAEGKSALFLSGNHVCPNTGHFVIPRQEAGKPPALSISEPCPEPRGPTAPPPTEQPAGTTRAF